MRAKIKRVEKMKNYPFDYLFKSGEHLPKHKIDEIIVEECLRKFKSTVDEDPLTEPEFDVIMGIIFSERTSQKINDLLDELQSYLMQNQGVKLQ